MRKSYEHYDVTDFLTDESFKKWILYHEESSFWHEFLEKHPHKRILVQEAKNILLTLSTNTQHHTDDTKSDTWLRIQEHISEHTRNKGADLAAIERKKSWKKVYYAAACLLLLTFVGIAYQYRHHKISYKSYTTAVGEQQHILLPDSSHIILSGAAELKLNSKWDREQIREVWLKGNAYFKINHLHRDGDRVTESDRFLVHTDKNSTIEVLGTVFNVSNTPEKMFINLEQGTIKVSKGQREMMLLPGEGLTVTETGMSRTNRPTLKPLWDSRELVMEEATLADVIALSEEIFGQEIWLEPMADPSQTIDGTIPFDQLDHVLQALSDLMQVQLKPGPKTPHFQKHNLGL